MSTDEIFEMSSDWKPSPTQSEKSATQCSACGGERWHTFVHRLPTITMTGGGVGHIISARRSGRRDMR